MSWLVIQTIAWCLIGFGVGALAAWLVAVMLFPHENEINSDSSASASPASSTSDEEGAA